MSENLLIPYRKNNKFAYANSGGQLVTEFKYDYCTLFIKGYSIFGEISNGLMNYGILDENFRQIVKPIFFSLERSAFCDRHFLGSFSISDEKYLFNYKGKHFSQFFINIETKNPIFLIGNSISFINPDLILIHDLEEKIVCHNLTGQIIFERPLSHTLITDTNKNDIMFYYGIVEDNKNGYHGHNLNGFKIEYDMWHKHYDSFDDDYSYFKRSRYFYYDKLGKEITREEYDLLPLRKQQEFLDQKISDYNLFLTINQLKEIKESTGNGESHVTWYYYESLNGEKFYE